jgi:hypothetical protein
MIVTGIAQPRTIAERLASGGIPIADALRYAMLLAEALRGIHDTGRVYGALCPASAGLTGSGLELLPALPPTSAVMPYTAPEVAAGSPPTARSDIFSFGAVAYQMLTGRPAFQGESPEELAESILRSNPQPSGVPSADRFLRGCLEKDPCARWQRMQKVVLELKVLMVVSHCTQANAARAREAADAVLRSEIRVIESRMAACLQEQHDRILEIRQSVGDAVGEIEQQLRATNTELAGVQALVERAVAAASLRVIAQAQEAIYAVGDRLAQSVLLANTEIVRIAESATSLGDRIAHLEQGFDSEKQFVAGLDDLVLDRAGGSKMNVKAHGVLIESTRIAVGHIEGLVGGVVEALDALPCAALEQHGEESLAAGQRSSPSTSGCGAGAVPFWQLGLSRSGEQLKPPVPVRKRTTISGDIGSGAVA